MNVDSSFTDSSSGAEEHVDTYGANDIKPYLAIGKQLQVMFSGTISLCFTIFSLFLHARLPDIHEVTAASYACGTLHFSCTVLYCTGVGIPPHGVCDAFERDHQ